MMLALKQKQMESCALQSEGPHLCHKELHLKQELERLSNQAFQSEDPITSKLCLQRKEQRN